MSIYVHDDVISMTGVTRHPLRESEPLIVLNGRQHHAVHLVVAVVLGQQQHREARVARGESSQGTEG